MSRLREGDMCKTKEEIVEHKYIHREDGYEVRVTKHESGYKVHGYHWYEGVTNLIVCLAAEDLNKLFEPVRKCVICGAVGSTPHVDETLCTLCFTAYCRIKDTRYPDRGCSRAEALAMLEGIVIRAKSNGRESETH